MGVADIGGRVHIGAQHRIDQDLAPELRRAVIAQHQRQANSHLPAGTVACSHNAVGINAEGPAGTSHPEQNFEGIFQLGGVGMFGRQAVIDQHHHAIGPIAISAHMSSWVSQVPRTQPPP